MAAKNMTHEEYLQKMRVANRKRYQLIKNDPVKYEQYRIKKREDYLRVREMDLKMSVNEMTHSEQRVTKQINREQSNDSCRSTDARSNAVLTISDSDELRGVSNINKGEAQMSELEKFKRRMIRSVARLLVQEKMPEDEVWEHMKKETGCDCKVLWQRMRLLTMKKLKRLQAADDRVDSIPAVAQMTLTDWLIFDLVIVHEKVDIIEEDKITAKNPDSRALTELFTLVQRFDIESRVGESLAEAWTAATVLYNTQGHQCSPMLMQRRWYQLKALTRSRFYTFWFTYRGNAKKLIEAMEQPPSRLQMAVAKRFPSIITCPLLDWEEMIKEDLVIMPDKFDEKMRMKVLPKPCDENSPDLVILDPIIETIDLGQESDSDSQESKGREDPVDNTLTDDIQIKNEPVDIDTDVKDEKINIISERITKPMEALASVEQEELLFENDNIDDECIVAEENNIINAVKSYETQVLQRVPEDITEPEVSPTGFDTHVPNEPHDMIPKITSIFGNIDITNETLSQISSLTQAQMVPETKYVEPRDNITNLYESVDLEDVESDEVEREVELEKMNDAEEDNIHNKNDSTAAELEQAIAMRAESYINKLKTKNNDLGLSVDYPNDSDFDSNGIEFVDDGIVYVDEDESFGDKSSGIPRDVAIKSEGDEVNESEKSLDDNDETPKFDLKLLMYPVVYTTKLDDMSVFKGDVSIDSVSDNNLIESIAAESKPISAKAVKVSDIKQEEEDMILQDDRGINDDLFKPITSSDESEEEIDDSKRVKLSSYLLQKPRSRSYNPIQLCKNPDFNTRLKRLPVSFFSSSRNRFLLKSCKPMTIDVTKAFETKLIDRTLYLKATDKPVVVIDDVNNTNNTISVLPSAMAVQSLIDNTNLKDVLTSPEQRHKAPHSNPNHSAPDEGLERNKVINLRDIMQVRRINQRLLTAEVPPIRVKNAHTIDIEEVATPRTSNNNSDISNIDLARQGVENDPTSNRENTQQFNLENEKNTSLAIFDTAPTNNINPDVTKEQDLNTDGYNIHEKDSCVVSDPVKELPSQAPNPNTVEYSNAHEIRNNDLKKDRGYVYLSKYKPIWRPATNDRSELSWTTKPKRTYNVSESLLTIDTLNKMLSVIDVESKDQQVIQKQKKKKVSKNDKSLVDSKSDPESKNINNGSNEKKKITMTTIVTVRHNIRKPKITISYGNKTNSNYKGNYCCWVRYHHFSKKNKASKQKISIHPCPANNCSCCCKKALNQSTAIVLSDDEDLQLKNACDSIERVVQQTRDIVSDNYQFMHKPCASLRAVSNISPIRRSIGTDPMEYRNCDEMEVSNKISEKTTKESANRLLRSHPQSENGNMVDMTTESQGSIILPQVISEISAPNVIEQITASTSPLAGSAVIDSAANAISSPVVTQTLNIQTDCNTMVDMPTESQDNIIPQIFSEISAPNGIQQISVPTTPLASPVLINSAANTISSPVVAQTINIQTDPNIKDTHSPHIVRPISNVDIISPNRHLVIDASKSLRIDQEFESNDNRCIARNRVLYLNSKYIAKKPSTSPISLGKNKILLTNVTLPRDVRTYPLPVAPEPTTAPNPIPALDTPHGVQLMLLANDQQTFTVETGTPIEPLQISHLPETMASVQQQFDFTNIPSTPVAPTLDHEDMSATQLVNLSHGVVHDNTVTAILSNNTNTSTNDEKNTELQVQSDSALNSVNAKEIATNVTINTMENVITGSQNTHEIVEQNLNEPQISDAINVKNHEDHDGTTTINLNTVRSNNIKESNKNNDNTILDKNRKSLLSDLMEMSGISAEDTTTSLFPEITPQGSDIPVPELIPLRVTEITTGNQARSLHDDNVLQESILPIPGLIHVDKNKRHINPGAYIPELSPVTSFAELKYACDHNGLFFKFDFETGGILPINVCIKKNPKNLRPNVNNIVPKAVIDLTDDGDVASKDQISHKKVPSILSRNSTRDRNSVKPVKVYKAGHSRSLLRKDIVATCKNLTQLNKKLISNRKRKQVFNRIEANIDLIDSDAPMEEEYLIESSSSDSNNSDDEPLINIAKRKRNINENTQEKELNDNTPATENVEQNNVPVESHIMASELVKSDDVIMKENPWNELVDSATDGSAPFLEMNDDKEDEDCILGV